MEKGTVGAAHKGTQTGSVCPLCAAAGMQTTAYETETVAHRYDRTDQSWTRTTVAFRAGTDIAQRYGIRDLFSCMCGSVKTSGYPYMDASG